MNTPKPLQILDRVPRSLLTGAEARSACLWVRDFDSESMPIGSLVRLIGLPWKLVVVEPRDSTLIAALKESAEVDDQLIAKRGFMQIVESDPSRIEFPQRCLPVYLLNGDPSVPSMAGDFADRLRKLTMLEGLRRANPGEILVIGRDDETIIPPELSDLWASGYRTYLTFSGSSDAAFGAVSRWSESIPDLAGAQLVRLRPVDLVAELVSQYFATYPAERSVARFRDRLGRTRAVDLTALDEPERPLLEYYALIQERDLQPITPEELREEEFVSFFAAPASSWRAYAAGLPWLDDRRPIEELTNVLRRIDAGGPEENRVAYITAEPGAGGTTLARTLAWHFAAQGYPTLVADAVPFVPDALPLANFLTRATHAAERDAPSASLGEVHHEGAANAEPAPRYEVPWLVVFDRIHWDGRDGELQRFRNELTKSGRAACLLVVNGPQRPLTFFNTSLFQQVADLNQAISKGAADRLGAHLNRFLRSYGHERHQWQWDRFHADHAVRYMEGQATFWVSLSFWIQGQYDMTESIQEWMYRAFRTEIDDSVVKTAILQIAALSSERLPLPEALLPQTPGRWPVSQLLDDLRTTIAALGLVRIAEAGQTYWAMVHDILGRFLINALFYDPQSRGDLGLSEAKDSEHLRFLLLRKLSEAPLLGERQYRALGEDFATTIFKIDPDHGHGSLTNIWRDVLEALDHMPHPLKDGSRVFRHHTAISRRRIAKLDARLYGLTSEDRHLLVTRAIEDIEYALRFIDYSPGSESNLNLYNSLANAYFDLADLELEAGADDNRIAELRRSASDATRRAFEESPTNSFVIETYVKNLLQSARLSSAELVGNCIEALGILYSALATNETTYRAAQLGDLADKALELLLDSDSSIDVIDPPRRPLDVLLNAWLSMVAVDGAVATDLADLSEDGRSRALTWLHHPVGAGNMQVLRLQYHLSASLRPQAFDEQLAAIEQLAATDYRMTPQLRLEHAILLFQAGRAPEGDRLFRRLREIWRDSEQFVQVPNRLRWLRAYDGGGLESVQAVTGSDYGSRAMARVPKFNNILVPFRPEEHGFREIRPATGFRCHVSFGHNGPFLRPVTVGP